MKGKGKRRIAKQFGMVLLFSASYFFMLIITVLLVFVGLFILSRIGIINLNHLRAMPLVMIAVVSLIIGSVMSLIFSRLPLKPFYQIINATNRIADGDYSVRLNLRGPHEMHNLNNSFNHMAEELGSVEMLRSDFVNNFSHEFKTPIVSIRGFAKMLKNGNITDEERTEYLDIIISESERLSQLSMNVLNLSKIEQQTILTDKTKFNLSEQIRLVIAMLYKKWDSKDLDIDFDCDEIYYTGNEEMLKQVWINLLDNAIKFAPEGGRVSVRNRLTPDSVSVTVADNGEGMDEQTLGRIFEKFYQGDASRTSQGNGLGLTLAKRVVTLHGGEIRASSKVGKGSAFTVRLPV